MSHVVQSSGLPSGTQQQLVSALSLLTGFLSTQGGIRAGGEGGRGTAAAAAGPSNPACRHLLKILEDGSRTGELLANKNHGRLTHYLSQASGLLSSLGRQSASANPGLLASLGGDPRAATSAPAAASAPAATSARATPTAGAASDHVSGATAFPGALVQQQQPLCLHPLLFLLLFLFLLTLLLCHIDQTAAPLHSWCLCTHCNSSLAASTPNPAPSAFPFEALAQSLTLGGLQSQPSLSSLPPSWLLSPPSSKERACSKPQHLHQSIRARAADQESASAEALDASINPNFTSSRLRRLCSAEAGFETPQNRWIVVLGGCDGWDRRRGRASWGMPWGEVGLGEGEGVVGEGQGGVGGAQGGVGEVGLEQWGVEEVGPGQEVGAGEGGGGEWRRCRGREKRGRDRGEWGRGSGKWWRGSGKWRRDRGKWVAAGGSGGAAGGSGGAAGRSGGGACGSGDGAGASGAGARGLEVLERPEGAAAAAARSGPSIDRLNFQGAASSASAIPSAPSCLSAGRPSGRRVERHANLPSAAALLLPLRLPLSLTTSLQPSLPLLPPELSIKPKLASAPPDTGLRLAGCSHRVALLAVDWAAAGWPAAGWAGGGLAGSGLAGGGLGGSGLGGGGLGGGGGGLGGGSRLARSFVWSKDQLKEIEQMKEAMADMEQEGEPGGAAWDAQVGDARAGEVRVGEARAGEVRIGEARAGSSGLDLYSLDGVGDEGQAGGGRDEGRWGSDGGDDGEGMEGEGMEGEGMEEDDRLDGMVSMARVTMGGWKGVIWAGGWRGMGWAGQWTATTQHRSYSRSPLASPFSPQSTVTKGEGAADAAHQGTGEAGAAEGWQQPHKNIPPPPKRRERLTRHIRALEKLVPQRARSDAASVLESAISFIKRLSRENQDVRKEGSGNAPPFI
ncbi:unnamed protein product [Closterium sp. NIES-64]|nr:unnamed protein product [Closterium sp. NIES-64]